MTLIFFLKRLRLTPSKSPSATTIIICYFLPIIIFLAIFF